MTTSVIVLALDDEVDARIRAVVGQQSTGARRLVPVGGPPGEYPDADPGPVRAVWIVSPPPPGVLELLREHAEQAEAYRVTSRMQWDERDGDSSVGPPTPLRLAF